MTFIFVGDDGDDLDNWPAETMGPYEENPTYFKKPLEKGQPTIWSTHHHECAYLEGDHPETCDCKALYERDYEDARLKQLEELYNPDCVE